ncbi:MAG TPA: hypothetical protein VEG34_09385 [Thermoanaerobaculia bacterium]|nr:hypothetical protein [Thermoanaerobaculia bacterium]
MRIATVVVRVVDGQGAPVAGLGPAELPSPEELLAEMAAEKAGAAGGEASAEVAPPPAPAAGADGKLVLFFVQADINSPQVRTKGHLLSLPYVRDFLDGLPLADRVAVVSFDSHLKLRLDFTRDRAAAADAVLDAIKFGSKAPLLRDRGPVSLATRFDAAAAVDAASPERALELAARSLFDLPGEKVIVYLGWGLGRYGKGGVTMTPDYAPAVQALEAARASVFVLDVTEASSHSLEVGLQRVAAESGGTYGRMSGFPAQAAARLARTISGHYVLTLDGDTVPDAGKVRIEVRKRGSEVLARPLVVTTTTEGQRRGDGG